MTINHSLLDEFLSKNHLAEREINKSNMPSVTDLELRKSTGSFYTPNDVTNFVWQVVLDEIEGQTIAGKLKHLINNYDVIEPSNGAGAFIFSYLRLLLKNNILDDWLRSPQHIHVNDVNSIAVSDFSAKINALNLSEKFIHSNLDGRIFLEQITTNLKPLIIGNPPYFKQVSDLDEGKHPDIYGDFVCRALNTISKQSGIASLLVPLSLTFSKNFTYLRKQVIDADMSKKIVNFDNMPDYVFKQGKSDPINTNKAISQRISLLTLNSNKKHELRSTELISWKTEDRAMVFSTPKTLFETKPIGRHAVLPKPFYQRQVKQLCGDKKLQDYVLNSKVDQNQKIYFGTTARNFLSVGLCEFRSTGISAVAVETAALKKALFYFLASRQALVHWKAIGDGFHVTKENLLLMPIPKKLLNEVDYFADLGDKLWRQRRKFMGRKINFGKENLYFNFVGATEFCESLGQ